MNSPGPVPSPDLGQVILTFLESDALESFGPDLLAFLQADEAAAGDPLKIEAAFFALEGDLAKDGVTFVGNLATQLAQVLAAKLQARLAAIGATPSPAAAAKIAAATK